MSPTIFKAGGLRFYFFSREERRVHVHVAGPDGEAKIWLEPQIRVARNDGLRAPDLKRALDLARERQDDIRRAWEEHFSG